MREDITKYFTKLYTERWTTENFIKAVAVLLLSAGFIWLTFSTFKDVESEHVILFLHGCNLLVLLFSIGGIAMCFSERQYQGITYEFDIYSLKNAEREKGSFSGSFFLGIGSISGSSEVVDYYVYFREERFGLKKDKMEAREVTLIQTDKVKPGYKEVLVDGNLYKALFVPKNTVKKKITIEV